MIFRLLALLALPVIAYMVVREINSRVTLSRGQSQVLFFIVAALLIIGVLIVLGRLPVQFIIAPLGAAAAFLLRMAPALFRLLPLLKMLRGRFGGAAGGPAGDKGSTIKTEFLEMHLDHNTGNMDGKVLKGEQSGALLSTLTLEKLLQLGAELGRDADSVQVLEAYLDRHHGQWREHADPGAGYGGNPGTGEAAEAAMSRGLALEILGLEGEPGKKEIVAAHRHLMQKMHPDRGGSDYLAKKINQAKDYLLKSL